MSWFSGQKCFTLHWNYSVSEEARSPGYDEDAYVSNSALVLFVPFSVSFFPHLFSLPAHLCCRPSWQNLPHLWLCTVYLLGCHLVLFLAPVSSANERCRRASAHGGFYLFGFRLEWNEHLVFSILVHPTGGLGGRWEQARISRCGSLWGSRALQEQGRSIGVVIPPVPSCAGHMLWSPGLGGRVLAYLRSRGCVPGSDVRHVNSPDGTEAGPPVSRHLDLVGRCLLTS